MCYDIVPYLCLSACQYKSHLYPYAGYSRVRDWLYISASGDGAVHVERVDGIVVLGRGLVWGRYRDLRQKMVSCGFRYAQFGWGWWDSSHYIHPHYCDDSSGSDDSHRFRIHYHRSSAVDVWEEGQCRHPKLWRLIRAVASLFEIYFHDRWLLMRPRLVCVGPMVIMIFSCGCDWRLFARTVAPLWNSFFIDTYLIAKFRRRTMRYHRFAPPNKVFLRIISISLN